MAYRFSQQTAAPDTRTVALYVRVSTGYQVGQGQPAVPEAGASELLQARTAYRGKPAGGV